MFRELPTSAGRTYGKFLGGWGALFESAPPRAAHCAAGYSVLRCGVRRAALQAQGKGTTLLRCVFPRIGGELAGGVESKKSSSGTGNLKKKVFFEKKIFGPQLRKRFLRGMGGQKVFFSREKKTLFFDSGDPKKCVWKKI